MRGSIVRFIDALKRRREESEEGFSLIELIVVVAILGILVAIAIPVFGNIQAQAAQSARKTVAANAATQIAASIATAPATAVAGSTLSNLETAETGLEILGVAGTGAEITVTPTNVGAFCVKATSVSDGTKFAFSGPGCTATDSAA